MENNVYEAPKADLTPEGENEVTPASRMKRLGGSIIDSILAGIVQTPILILLFGTGMFTGDEQLSLVETLISSAIGIVVFIILQGHYLKKYGQTIGKRILNMKIVTLEDEKPDIKRNLVPRYLFIFGVGAIPVAGPIIVTISFLFIFGKEHRCGHDLIAKTKVIDCINE